MTMQIWLEVSSLKSRSVRSRLFSCCCDKKPGCCLERLLTSLGGEGRAGICANASVKKKPVISAMIQSFRLRLIRDLVRKLIGIVML